MSADRLREAATKLRAVAKDARVGRWVANGAGVQAVWAFHNVPVATCDGSVLSDGNRANARFIASMDPVVALAVADWLERESRRIPTTEALAVAEAVLA